MVEIKNCQKSIIGVKKTLFCVVLVVVVIAASFDCSL